VNTFNVTFRFANEADYGAIESLINAGFPNDLPVDKETIASWIAARGRVIVAVATHGIIGCVRMDPDRKGLFHLVVVPELRKKGLGARLVAEFEGAARQLGWPQVLLGVDSATPGLVGYYRSLGYEPTGDVAAMFDHAGNEDPVRKLIMMGKILPPT
jgi:GNAT superfamily N-acetyltransferase